MPDILLLNLAHRRSSSHMIPGMPYGPVFTTAVIWAHSFVLTAVRCDRTSNSGTAVVFPHEAMDVPRRWVPAGNRNHRTLLQSYNTAHDGVFHPMMCIVYHTSMTPPKFEYTTRVIKKKKSQNNTRFITEACCITPPPAVHPLDTTYR